MRTFLLIIFFIGVNCLKASDSLNCVGKFDKEGKKHGKWVCRNNDGKLMRKESFKHGVITTWMLYNAKGQLIEARNRKGKVKNYHPCGC